MKKFVKKSLINFLPVFFILFSFSEVFAQEKIKIFDLHFDITIDENQNTIVSESFWTEDLLEEFHHYLPFSQDFSDDRETPEISINTVEINGVVPEFEIKYERNDPVLEIKTLPKNGSKREFFIKYSLKNQIEIEESLDFYHFTLKQADWTTNQMTGKVSFPKGKKIFSSNCYGGNKGGDCSIQNEFANSFTWKMEEAESLDFFNLSVALSKNDRESSGESLSRIYPEVIEDFHSLIEVQKDGSIIVTEIIKVYANSKEIKHGILRYLPLTRVINERETGVDYKILSVKRDGKPEKYKKKSNNGFKVFYIGDKKVELPKGEYEYEIQYKTKNQIGFFDDFDELYWNVTGNGWTFPIKNASATMRFPSGTKILQQACYTGSEGSTFSDCWSYEPEEKNVVNWETSNLFRGEGLTVAAGIPKGIVKGPPPMEGARKYGLTVILSLIFLTLLVYYYFSWKKHGIDPPSPTVFPQFNPPNSLSPASIGYITKGFFETKTLVSSVISLAQKGYLEISRKNAEKYKWYVPKKFQIEILNKPVEDDLPEEEKLLLEELGLCSDENDILELDGKHNTQLALSVTAFKEEIERQHRDFLYQGLNRNKLTLPFLSIFSIFILGILISNYLHPSTAIMPAYIVAFFVILIICFLTAYALIYLKFNKYLAVFLSAIYIIPAVMLIQETIKAEHDYNFAASVGFLFFSAYALLWFQYLIKKPSKELLKLQAKIEGFKMYIHTTDTKRLQAFKAPEMSEAIFGEVLPYAIALGEEKKWSQKFDDYLKLHDGNYSLAWYSGQSFSNASSFSSSLSSGFSASFASTSGSGGGGASGGGGGGGGGGGW